MDTLSDLLRAVRFTGGLFLEARFRSPWCLQSQITKEDCGPGVDTHGGLVAFHYVLHGRVEVRLGRETVRDAGPGELIVLPRNYRHLLGSDLALPPLDAGALVRKAPDDEFAHIDFGKGADPRQHFVCGFLATAMRGHPLLAALPALIIADLRDRPCAEWAQTSFRYAAREHASNRPGSQEVLARLSELLFVEAVRGHIERLPGEATGWLAALRDPPLARALSALHEQPAVAWTTETLAGRAFLSRSAFADRFTRMVGVPPMSYLTRWRMLLAGQRLRESSETIAQVAAAVGYESESTFSRAFARELGVAPRAWRRSAAAAS
ncbi:MAG: AraC family transcriptional regulator [Opitutaceae bacterium]|nr:AraC family transcriptional regulator [Opitutaceae bacterium]